MSKKYLFLLLPIFIVFLSSCLENDTSIYYTDLVSMEAGAVPDTVEIYTPVEISLRAVAPNGCWKNIQFIVETDTDSTYEYGAFATYTNHGEVCDQSLVTMDTVFTIVPIAVKKYYVAFYSAGEDTRIDTIVVTDHVK